MKKRNGAWLLAGWIMEALSVNAQESETYSWSDIHDPDLLPEGVVAIEEDGRLRIEGKEGSQQTIPLMTIQNPPVTAMVYSLSGQIQYTDVEGDAYLEMWSHFGDAGSYFSRTVSAMGPSAKITGTSKERKILMPFNRSGTEAPPEKLVVNLVLPGKGEVLIGPLTLKNVGDSMVGMGAPEAFMGTAWLVIAMLVAPVVLVLLVLVVVQKARKGGSAESTESRKMKALDL